MLAIGAGIRGSFVILYLIVYVIEIVALWRVFSKANFPGWGALVPFYNTYLVCKVAGRPGWWMFLVLVPVLNIAILILLMVDISRNFGRSLGFAFGTLILPVVFVPILGFGSSEYSHQILCEYCKSRLNRTGTMAASTCYRCGRTQPWAGSAAGMGAGAMPSPAHDGLTSSPPAPGIKSVLKGKLAEPS